MSDLNLPTRKRLRLKGYDYAIATAYFVTVCVDLRFSVLGSIADGVMKPTPLGAMVNGIWEEIPDHYAGVLIDEFVLMPNHFHAIVVLENTVGAGPLPGPHQAKPLSLPDIMRRFKSLTGRRYQDGVSSGLWPRFSHQLWQRGYHDRIVRDDIELAKIRMYIQDNPARWDEDEENPKKGN